MRTRSNRTVGYNFRFSVSKSVSLLYGMNGDHTILDAFRAAVDEKSICGEMEGEMKSRVRKSGQDADRITGNMVWAEFFHTTSGPVDGLCDPQLHASVFVFNMTSERRSQMLESRQFRDLKQDGPYFTTAFRVRLADKLQDLGFGVEREGDDFEVAGIPSDVLDRFSRRTTLIERLGHNRVSLIQGGSRNSGPGPAKRRRARAAWN